LSNSLKNSDIVAQNLALQAEVVRLNKIVDALAERAEQAMDVPHSSYGVFQSTIMLEGQVRSRTHDLQAALQRNERISRVLKIANESLEQSEKRFRNIVEHMPIGMCIIDMEYRHSLVNKAYCDLVGYDKDELDAMTPLDMTHPDDVLLSRGHLQRLVDGEIDSYQVEKRYICKDGSIVWVHLTTSMLRDAKGAPCNFIGQIQDITGRRLAEERLRLAAAVYNYSNEAMMITDARNQIVATNPAFTALTGYGAEEALGQNPRILGSGRQDKGFYAGLWKTLSSENHWEGDVWNRKKNGEIYAEWLSITAVQDENGVTQNYVALFSDVTEEKVAAEQILEHANYDPLTRLPNRRLFYDRLNQGMKQSDRSGESLALLFMDLDYFKEVNDSLGHQAGDELLIQVASRISAKVRSSDTVARLGGDEFTAILLNTTDADAVGRVAESIVDALSQPFTLGSKEAHISASIGISVYPNDAKDMQTLLKEADEAMYLSKCHGRNRFTCFQSAAQDIIASI